jgi:hypothetical protein
MSAHDHPSPAPITGSALIFFAFDIGFQVDLEAAESVVQESSRKKLVRARRAAPAWFDYNPPPLRVRLDCEPVQVASATTEAQVEVLIYDFGAVLLTYRLPLPDTLDALPELGWQLYEHAKLSADARQRAAQVLDLIRPAVEKPKLADAFEDYTVYAISHWGQITPEDILNTNRELIARTIEAERVALSDVQIARTTQVAMSYASTDLAVIDWNAAVLFDADPEDIITVLQHANVELLEFRILDEELDSILDHADETLAALTQSRLWPSFASSRLLRRFASVQTDTAVMFEGVNNAIKLLGNQYLAQVYRATAARLDLPAWHAGILRKLEATESIYQKMSDSTSTKRLEVLEWVIIVLIAVSIALPFTPWYH